MAPRRPHRLGGTALAGQPRRVIALMVDLLLVGAEDATSKAKIIRTVYDPVAGTGGMLSVMDEHLRTQNTTARLKTAGQEVDPSSYAVCKADMVIPCSRNPAHRI